MKFNTIFLFCALCVCFSTGIFIPAKAHAILGEGGYDIADFYEFCDCSQAIISAFGPLYLNNPTPTVGYLTWYPGTFDFLQYDLTEGEWNLGQWMPELQECYVYVYPSCVLFPTEGAIFPPAGSSPPTL